MRSSFLSFSRVLCLLALGASSLLTPPASGDDRDLLREAVGNPYVFILFDTSGSMNKAPRCTLEDFNRPLGDPRKCSPLCPTGDCYAALQADDPSSKFYQAKEALYEVLRSIDDVHFGFATYNQDTLYVRDKHWLYKVSTTQPYGLFTLLDGTRYPATGSQHVLGRTWSCRAGSDVGCRWCARCATRSCREYSVAPAHVDTPWEIDRVGRLPKLHYGGTSTEFYIQDTQERVYRVMFHRLQEAIVSGQTLGLATLDVKLSIERCTNTECTSTSAISGSPRNVRFERVDEFLSWDAGAQTTEPGLGFFTQSAADDAPAANSCTGWDANDDVDADNDPADPYTDSNHNSYNLRFPTVDDTVRGDFFDVGDVLPLDWLDTHRDEILHRFAPNTRAGLAVAPDFGLSSYFADTRDGNDLFLRLRDESQRPILPFGATPLGNSIKSFRNGTPAATTARAPGWSAGATTPPPTTPTGAADDAICWW
ncbi:MAG: hypothetical protein HC897_07770 [Thermoanaerobaculia bacterium]|nr:hypothetical protein [Thermoanaerobaculia bacterium]